MEPWLGGRVRAFYTVPGLRSENQWLMHEDQPAVWLVGLDVVRRPYERDGLTFAPFLAAGPVAKWYGFERDYLAGGAGVAGGVEFWRGRLGLVAEAGHAWSRFRARGIRDTSRDWLYTVGLSLPLSGARPGTDGGHRGPDALTTSVPGTGPACGENVGGPGASSAGAVRVPRRPRTG